MLQFWSEDGTIWVQGGDTFQTELPLKRLGHGLRLGATVDGGRMVIELRVARITDDSDWSNLFQASVDELDTAAGVSIAEVLCRFGAEEVGTRAEVIGDTGRRRNFACVIGDPDAPHLPVVAHYLTRVLPLSMPDRGPSSEA